VAGHWRPVPLHRSLRAKKTIRCIGLDAPDFLELYDLYVKSHIEPLASIVKDKIRANDAKGVKAAWLKLKRLLFSRTAPYKALSYDVLDGKFPRSLRERWRIVLPRP
jgi:hypothetical protein